MSDTQETPAEVPKFDFSAFPEDTLFYDRRTGLERRQSRPDPPIEAVSPRRKKDRRRRVDPTTFEKQYSKDEIEFMTAMQQFKNRTGKAFPSYAEVLRVARSLGYARSIDDESEGEEESASIDPVTGPDVEVNPSPPLMSVLLHAGGIAGGPTP